MTAWIIYFRDNAAHNRQYIQFYKEEGLKLGIDVKLILVEELSFGVRDNRLFVKYQLEDIELPAFVIYRAIHPLLNRQLELMGIPVFNNSFVSEICNDKARTYQYLAKTGIPMVDTCFYCNSQLQGILEALQQTTVIKAVEGHGGSQVFLAEPKTADHIVQHNGFSSFTEQTNNPCTQSNEHKEAFDKDDAIRRTIMTGIGSSDFVAQPLTGNRHQDLRVYVIGTEIIAAVLRTAKDGFKSNYSLGGEVCLYQLSSKEKAIVNTIIDQFEFDLVGIDFIIGDAGELIFNEIEDVVGSRMLYQCSDINIVELYLKYILNKLGKVEACHGERT